MSIEQTQANAEEIRRKLLKRRTSIQQDYQAEKKRQQKKRNDIEQTQATAERLRQERFRLTQTREQERAREVAAAQHQTRLEDAREAEQKIREQWDKERREREGEEEQEEQEERDDAKDAAFDADEQLPKTEGTLIGRVIGSANVDEIQASLADSDARIAATLAQLSEALAVWDETHTGSVSSHVAAYGVFDLISGIGGPAAEIAANFRKFHKSKLRK